MTAALFFFLLALAVGVLLNGIRIALSFYQKESLTLAPDGRNLTKTMVLRQIQNGKYIVVAPTKYAADPVVYPRVAPQ